MTLLQIIERPEVLLIVIIELGIQSFILEHVLHHALFPAEQPIELLLLLEHVYLVVVII